MRLYLCSLWFVWLVWFCHYNCLRFPPFNEGPLLLRTRHKRNCSSSAGTGWQKSCQQIFCCFQMLHNKHFSVLAIELSTQFFIVPLQYFCFEDYWRRDGGFTWLCLRPQYCRLLGPFIFYIPFHFKNIFTTIQFNSIAFLILKFCSCCLIFIN